MKVRSLVGSLCLIAITSTIVACDNSPPSIDQMPIDQKTADEIPARPLQPLAENSSTDVSKNAIELLELPPGGVIPGKTGAPTQTCGTECSCQSVQLVRVTSENIKQEGGWIFNWEWYPATIHYQLGDNSNPPESGPLYIPERRLHDRMCFHFSYPPCSAYWRWNGDNSGCTALVEVRWPVQNSVTGERIYTWQLYGVQGWNMGPTGDFRNGTPNVVCLSAQPDGHQIPPGRGEIKWSVESQVCSPSVAFEISARP